MKPQKQQGKLKKGVSGVLGPLSCSRTPVRSARQSACGLAERTFLNFPSGVTRSVPWWPQWMLRLVNLPDRSGSHGLGMYSISA